MYWKEDVKWGISPFIFQLRTERRTAFKVVAAILMGGMSTFIHLAGDFHLLITLIATAPIIIAMLIGPPYGLMSYALTVLLLLWGNPSQLIVFSLGTGLLAVGIGLSIFLFNKRWTIISLSSFILTVGLSILLYALNYPLFFEVHMIHVPLLLIVSFIYSWLWIELVIMLLPVTFKSLNRVKLKG